MLSRACGCHHFALTRAAPDATRLAPCPPSPLPVLADINANFHSSAGELSRLIPIQRKLTEVQNDVGECLEAISGEAGRWQRCCAAC